ARCTGRQRRGRCVAPVGRSTPGHVGFGRPGHARPGVRHAAARRRRQCRGGDVVARPPLRVSIEPMGLDDLPTVQAIEEASFTTPWPPHAYRSEIETNRLAQYIVARVGGEVVAYAGMWMMVDEAHETAPEPSEPDEETRRPEADAAR